jgi:hypothetical protein
MSDIANVRKVGSLMVVRFSDGTQQTVYPSTTKLWTTGTGYVEPSPPPPAPTDPIAGEGPTSTFTRENPPQSPNQVPRSAYGPYGTSPTGITIHHWGATGQSFDAVVAHLSNPDSQVSAHAVVEAGRVSFLVPYSQAAFHSGSAEGNGSTVGLELRPEATDGDYETAAQLIREIRGEFGNIPLYPHNHWFNTICPGVWDLARLDSMSRVTTPPPGGSPTPTGVWTHPLPGAALTGQYGESRGAYMHVGQDLSTVSGYGPGGDILAITDMVITVARENGAGGLPDAGTYVKGHTIAGEQYSFSHFHGYPGSLAVSVGQHVNAGTKLMVEGATGNSTGAHLHLEIWNGHMPGDFFYWGNGTPPNPLPIMRAKGIQI